MTMVAQPLSGVRRTEWKPSHTIVILPFAGDAPGSLIGSSPRPGLRIVAVAEQVRVARPKAPQRERLCDRRRRYGARANLVDDSGLALVAACEEGLAEPRLRASQSGA